MSPPVKSLHQPAGKRRVLFRLAAVVAGLLVLVAIELALAVSGLGVPEQGEDPFVGFEAIHPLFVANSQSGEYEIAQSRRAFFRPQSFAATKEPDSFRAFFLGGSTVQGRPFSTETAFPAWLQVNLECLDPERRWEMVNCGGVSYASYRLVPILQECLTHQPDLIVICSGHNEFLEDRSYAHVRERPDWLRGMQRLAARSRIHAVLSGWLRNQRESQANESRPVLSSEVDALLDYRGGLEVYHRDLQWQAGVKEHYLANLERMIAMCRREEVPVLLVLPTSNLSDCPPFKSLPSEGLTASDRSRLRDLTDRAQQLNRNDPSAAADLLEQACRLDPSNASLAYSLGKCLEASGRPDRALQAFTRARDLDVCPLRILSDMEDGLRELAARTETPLLDAQALMTQAAGGKPLGGYLLVDHIHPSVRGHQLIAEALLNLLDSEGLLVLPDGWEERLAGAQRAHLESLDELYFLRGMRTLQALEAWTQGRADGPPIDQRRRPVRSQ